MNTLRRYIMEPVCALTHLVAALAACAGTVVLVVLTRDEPVKMISLLVYGLSMVLLYTASTLYHGVKAANDDERLWLNRLDHVAIFLLIAGTYTPIVVNMFAEPWRSTTLAAVWLAALAGTVYKLVSNRIHGFLNTSIYPLFSWGGALPVLLMPDPLSVIPAGGLALIGLGGLIYTTGFVTYYLERPDPWPQVFGHHEIWHLFVIAGSLCHFLFMLLYVVPFEGVSCC